MHRFRDKSEWHSENEENVINIKQNASTNNTKQEDAMVVDFNLISEYEIW